MKKIGNVENIPDTRACPKCHTLIHHKEQCKHILGCPGCKTYFCFVCLGIKVNGEWPCGDAYDPCKIAPRQVLDN